MIYNADSVGYPITWHSVRRRPCEMTRPPRRIVVCFGSRSVLLDFTHAVKPRGWQPFRVADALLWVWGQRTVRG
jgi:hypothetical protein